MLKMSAIGWWKGDDAMHVQFPLEKGAVHQEGRIGKAWIIKTWKEAPEGD